MKTIIGLFKKTFNETTEYKTSTATCKDMHVLMLIVLMCALISLSKLNCIPIRPAYHFRIVWNLYGNIPEIMVSRRGVKQ